MKLDGFDRLVAGAAALILAAAALYGLNGGGRIATGAAAARAFSTPPPPDVYPRLAAARALMDAGQVRESVDALTKIEAEFPALPDARALLGQAYARLQEYPKSMGEFRAALMMDPAYVDKKSVKFIGKRIKAALRDGMAEARAKLSKNPGDAGARAELKDAYYIKGMLAGGCE